MACNNTCKICPKAIYSNSVTVVAIAGTETLVIDIPAGYYPNGGQYCLFIIQSISATATINMPVAISIGGVTTTVYPLVRCDCSQVTACGIRTRHRYTVRVSTNATGGVFKVIKGLSCMPDNSLTSIPVAAPAPTPTA